MSQGGWTVCPICGSVVADAWLHTEWHTWVLADLIADIASGLLPEELVQDVGDTGPEAPIIEESEESQL